MSLKALHIVFVVASVLMCLGCGAWALHAYFTEGGTLALTGGILSLISAVALGIYGWIFLKKLKDISYL